MIERGSAKGTPPPVTLQEPACHYTVHSVADWAERSTVHVVV
jgi:hypothetical protein